MRLIGPALAGAHTRVAGVIGSPVRHSLSPAMHNAAFRELDLDWVYVAFEVAPDSLAAAFDGVRALGIGGLSVTIPHKGAALAAVDEATATAAAVGAVNTVVSRTDGSLLGDNTDGSGFLASLEEERFDPSGRICAVIGAGGAARAVVYALAGAGAAEVIVVNRTRERGESAAALAGAAGRVGTATDLAQVDLIVNATPLGLAGSGGEELPVDPRLVGPGQLLVDLIPNPAMTPLMRGASDNGARVAGGLGMLVHQGAAAFELWTGRPAPIAVMRAAAATALG